MSGDAAASLMKLIDALDDDGYLTITDRVSDIIIRGGENIGSVQIENAFAGRRQDRLVGVLEKLGLVRRSTARMRATSSRN